MPAVAAADAAPGPKADAPERSRRGEPLREVLRAPGFARLISVRLAAQVGDGIFQASLAGAVLFSPERQATGADVAAGFAVLLLPYSVIGPFAGVLLDRWSRQRVMVAAGLARALLVLVVAAEISGRLHGLPFYASALVVLSLSRLFLAGMSAALPHVVAGGALISANALTTTGGALATTLGGAGALLARVVTGADSVASYVVMALTAAVPYGISALAAAGFARDRLGPDDVERSRRESAGDIVRGLRAGVAHLRGRRPALVALVVIGVHRLCYGLVAVATLLVFRNHYVPDGPARAGLAGLAQFIVLAAIGGGCAALVTPTLTRRVGLVRWPAALLVVSACVDVGLVLPYRLPLHLAAGLALGFASQGIKICVDTQLQRAISDEFRGRVFTIYDTVFNLALVLAAVITAVELPADGRSPITVVVIAAGYLTTAAAWLLLSRAVTGSPTAAADARPTTA